MPRGTDLGTVARIRALAQEGWPDTEIAVKLGVSHRTVRRYLDPALREYELGLARHRRHEGKNPLFDPKRDGMRTLSLTAELMGDPQPGRRALVARNRRAP